MRSEPESDDLATVARPRSDADALLAALRALASAHDLPSVMSIVRRAARELTRADGVTFVLREGPMVHYADEDAIAPLWKGRRFPATACISGWAMIHRESVVIEDIYADGRIPHDAYRATFVKSLAMVPIRREDPLGAIGAYWAEPHLATPRQVSLLESLAAAAALAVANADLVARLHGAVRLRDEFIALAAPELATPFSAVRLRAGSLARVRSAQPEPADLDRLAAAIDRLGDVIGALGAFSRASRDGIGLARSGVDLSEIARAAAERVRARDRTDQTGTPISVAAPGPIVGEWDGEKLAQAVAHLVENAAKFGRGHPVEVRVHDHGDDARVAVRDHGPGISESDHERIFGRFERACSAASHGGLGLGLWMARAIAEAHGGAISVESSPGAGATFTLVVPKRLPVES
ncbi:MAG TPA: GAF domain-containing sensor histidine kinase [Anaeromyxobacter sp.]|nr:GAF domain-containing sensor histidine kinase [Anaeromyxobacter sp.]